VAQPLKTVYTDSDYRVLQSWAYLGSFNTF